VARDSFIVRQNMTDTQQAHLAAFDHDDDPPSVV
jgi:hypothetical protein